MNKKLRILIFFLLLANHLLKAQSFSSSNLPIVVIHTDRDPKTGAYLPIIDDPKILASMLIIKRTDGNRNSLSDSTNVSFINYKGRIGIELRGSTSQLLPKKPYGLTTLKEDNKSNNNVSILGMPAENDWVLNSLAYDSSLIRDYLSYDIARSTGNYASRGVYCEVFINGAYMGLYVMMEKLKINVDRINITKIGNTDTLLPNLTGGYITKADKPNGDIVAWTMTDYSGKNVDFIHESPKPESIAVKQNQYIYSVFDSLKNVSYALNASIQNGYPSIIDVPSFVDFMLINELAANVDGYQYSTYFHKERGGKLRAGPVWDFNLTYGNDLFFWNLDRSFTNVWQFDNGDNTGPRFWKDLYTHPTFKCYLAKRWNELTKEGQAFDKNLIYKKIDELVLLIAEAKTRESATWGRVGDHSKHIANIKKWLAARIDWISLQFQNAGTCVVPTIPNIVISKIHYNPATINGVAKDSLEFIELTNNSNASVNLTGFYFRALGYQYQFPVGSSLAANKKIYIASDSVNFKKIYGVSAFGKSAINLPNQTQKLILSDAFGNTIDEVEYATTAPWPTAANGLGSYLSLTSITSDNTIGANWVSENAALDTDKDGIADFADDCPLWPSSPPIAPVISRWNDTLMSSWKTGNQWYQDGQLIKDTTQKIKPSASGNYTSKTNQQGCLSSLSMPYYYLLTDLVKINGNEFIQLSPNPFNQILNFDFVLKGYSKMNIEVFEIASGRKVYSKNELLTGTKMQLGELAKGLYLIKVFSSDNKMAHSFKMVKI